jgi:hypothetical protein
VDRVLTEILVGNRKSQSDSGVIEQSCERISARGHLIGLRVLLETHSGFSLITFDRKISRCMASMEWLVFSVGG